MIWTKQLIHDGMGRNMGWEYPKGEWKEFREAKTLKEKVDEWNDVCGCLALFLTNKTGINIPLLPGFGKQAGQRWYKRNAVWQEIFEVHKVKFSPVHLGCGSNYHKKHKVLKALRSAGYEGTVRWGMITVIVGHWEDR